EPRELQLRRIATGRGVHRVEAGAVDTQVDRRTVGGPAGAVQGGDVADALELLRTGGGVVRAAEHVGQHGTALAEVARTAAVAERVVGVVGGGGGRLDHVLPPLGERPPVIRGRIVGGVAVQVELLQVKRVVGQVLHRGFVEVAAAPRVAQVDPAA